MPRLQHITHDTLEDCHQTCLALEKLIKAGKVRPVPTPNAAGQWDIGYVTADRYEEAMKDRVGSVILAGPKEIIRHGRSL